MSITFTGSKTVTKALAPHLTALRLTALMAIAPENLTLAELKELNDAVNRVAAGDESTTLGTLLV